MDWLDFMQLSGRPATWVTLPLEAPEGALGAATVGLGVHMPGEQLMRALRDMAAALAQALTHAKCKHDYAVRRSCNEVPLALHCMHFCSDGDDASVLKQVAMSLLRSAYPAGIVSTLLAQPSAGASLIGQPAAPASIAPPPPPAPAVAEQAADSNEDDSAKTASPGESLASSSDEDEDGIGSSRNAPSMHPLRPTREAAAAAGALEASPADFYRSWIAAHVYGSGSQAQDAGQKQGEAEWARGRAFLAASQRALSGGCGARADQAQLLQKLAPDAWGTSRHSSSSSAVPGGALGTGAAASGQAGYMGLQLASAEHQAATASARGDLTCFLLHLCRKLARMKR